MSTTKPTQPTTTPWAYSRHADNSGWTLHIDTDDRDRVALALVRIGHNAKRPRRATLKAYTRWRTYIGDYTLHNVKPAPQSLTQAVSAVAKQAPHLPPVPDQLLGDLRMELRAAGVIDP